MPSSLELLVGTHSHLLWVVLDPSWGVRQLRSLARGHHYGIALPPDGRTVLAKHRDEYLDVRDRTGALQRCGRVALLGDLGQVHQVAWMHEGVVMANTVGNSVVYQSLDGRVRHEHHIDGARHDVNHVNSVFVMDGQALAVLNNRGARESEVLVLDVNPTTGIQAVHRFSVWHRACHNLHIDDEQMAYNASSSGRFVVVDVPRQQVATDHGFDGHTKGLSVTSEYYIIGVSDHAERSDRYHAASRLVVLDRLTHAIVAEIPLWLDGQAVGNVNEIRCLSEPELGHATDRGLRDPWPDLRFASGDRGFRLRESARGLARRLVRGIPRR